MQPGPQTGEAGLFRGMIVFELKMAKRYSRKELRERKDLVGEHPLGGIGQIVIELAFSVTWGVDTFFLNHSTFLNDTLPFTIRLPLAVVVLVMAGYLSRTGLNIVFGETRVEPAVIRKSVFSIVRHPVYLGEILLFLGLLLLSVSLAALLIWLVAIVFLVFAARYEEKLLLQTLGDSYRQYMQDVPMWIPRLRRR
jgi:protein-S-isoprenylcysteine O-methyltransferase Ste14